jgi:hypothetical protein
MDFDFFQMIAKAVQKDCGFNVLVRLGNDEPSYVSKVKQGIMLYEPRKHPRPTIFKSRVNKNILMHRQICSLRITQKSCLR